MKALVLVCLLAGIAAAEPRWVSGPDKAYNCTHYLVDAMIAKPGAPMKLVMRATKVMTFTLKASAAKSKVRYELETPPAGAKLAGAKFTWTVAGAPGAKFDFALVAIADDGTRAKWPLSVTIADDKLVTAWSAGLGSVWPDCDVVHDTTNYSVEDLDGDGKDDVVYRSIHPGEEGVTEAHVMLQRGKLKFVEAYSCFKCGPEGDVAADGTRLLIVSDDCCCILSLEVMRFDKDGVVSVGSWQVPSSCTPDPGDITRLDFTRDAKQRITGLEESPARGKMTRYKWRNKMLERQ